MNLEKSLWCVVSVYYYLLTTSIQNFGPPSNKATEGLPQHGFARITKWEYLGKTSSESSTLPNSSGDSSVKLDFGLSNTMLDNIPSEWKNYQFGVTYSVTLSKDDLETSLAIRNTGEKDLEFQTLLHSYWAIDVSRYYGEYDWRGGANELFERQADRCCLTEHFGRLSLWAREGFLRRQSWWRKKGRIRSYHYFF